MFKLVKLANEHGCDMLMSVLQTVRYVDERITDCSICK